jgi:hypothetical protein
MYEAIMSYILEGLFTIDKKARKPLILRALGVF